MTPTVKSNREYVAGLDIGGTSMVGAIVESATGRLISDESIPTASRAGIPDGLSRIGELIARLSARAGIEPSELGGIGIGATGPVDTAAGMLVNQFNLPGWEGMPIVAHLSQRFGIPAFLIGDCDVAVLGEFWRGAGRGYSNIVYITVGTGIGAGLMFGGRLHRPVGSATAEVGHTTLDMHGAPCYCGGRGCWEALASAPAIVRRAKEAYAAAPAHSPLIGLIQGDPERISAELVSQAAALGDPIAQTLVEETAIYMGIGLSNIMNFLAPDVVILGGGVMRGWPQFEPVTRRVLRERGTVAPFDLMKVVPAQLGLRAGVTGAAKAILDRLDGRL